MNYKKISLIFTSSFLLLTSCGSSHHFDKTIWKNDGTNHWHECSDEGCGEKVDVGEHTYDDGVITTSSTCTAKGIKTFTCTVCNYSYTEEVAKAEHTKAATRSFNEDYHWYACTVCGEQLEKTIHHFDQGVISKQATCTERGVTTYSCSDCNFSYTEGIVPEGHKTGDWEKDSDYHWKTCATCTEQVEKNSHSPVGDFKLDDDYHWKVCECGQILNKTLHTMNWTVKTPASYSNPGLEEGVCSECGKKDTREIPQLTVSASDIEAKINALPDALSIEAKTKQAITEIENLITLLAAGETVSEACLNKLNLIRNTYETTYEVAYSMSAEKGGQNWVGNNGQYERGLVDSTYGPYMKATFGEEYSQFQVNRVDKQFNGSYQCLEFYIRASVTVTTTLYSWANEAWSNPVNVSLSENQWVKVTLNKAFVNGVMSTKENQDEAKRTILLWKDGYKFPAGTTIDMTDIYGMTDKTADWGVKALQVSNSYDTGYNTNRWGGGSSTPHQLQYSPYGPLFYWDNFTKETETFYLNHGPIDGTGVAAIKFAFYTNESFTLEMKTGTTHTEIIHSYEVVPGWTEITLEAGVYQFNAITKANSFDTFYYKATAGLKPSTVFAISGFWTVMA